VRRGTADRNLPREDNRPPPRSFRRPAIFAGIYAKLTEALPSVRLPWPPGWRLHCLAICPAVPAALWLIFGILAVLLPTYTSAGFATPTFAMILPAAVLWLAAPPGLRRLGCFLPVGIALALLHVHAPWQTYLACLPRPECSAEIRAGVIAAPRAPENLAWSIRPAEVTLRLKAIRLTPDDAWQACAGKIRVRAGSESALACGDLVQARGAFVKPESALIPGAFDYAAFLRNQGIRRVFDAHVLDRVGHRHGWPDVKAALEHLRNRCAAALVAHVRNARNARVLLAMTLGDRQALDPATRRRFLRSGTIHVFAVSGLHVGIVASILLLAARLFRVPFRARWLALPGLLGVYVLMTGAAPSAVRAWLMLSLWSVSRALFRATVPINTVAVAAILLLLINPLHLAQSGFQFSFLIVTVLVLGWHGVSKIATAVDEKRFWVPARIRAASWWTHLPRRLVQLLGGSLLAWFGSAGLIAWTNHLLIPAALFVNLGMSFLAWLTLFLAGPKILLALLPFPLLDTLCAACLELVLNTIHGLVSVGSGTGSSLALAKPPGWAVVAYYLILLALLLPRRPLYLVRSLGGLGLCAMLGLMHLRSAGRVPECVVFHGGRTAVPALVLTTGDGLGPVVLNTGGPDCARAIVDWLTLHGHEQIETLILPGDSWALAGGAPALFDAFPVLTLSIAGRELRQGHLHRAADRQWQERGRIRRLGVDAGDATGRQTLRTPAVAATLEKRGEQRVFTLARRGHADTFAATVTVRADGGAIVQWRWNRGDYGQLHLQPSLNLRIHRLPPAQPATTLASADTGRA